MAQVYKIVIAKSLTA